MPKFEKAGFDAVTGVGKLATGGILPGPLRLLDGMGTSRIAGEAGREAILPLDTPGSPFQQMVNLLTEIKNNSAATANKNFSVNYEPNKASVADTKQTTNIP